MKVCGLQKRNMSKECKKNAANKVYLEFESMEPFTVCARMGTLSASVMLSVVGADGSIAPGVVNLTKPGVPIIVKLVKQGRKKNHGERERKRCDR